MKLGIFAGGFKPFHAGHFAKLQLAINECDHVIVSFGKGERKKGSDLFYSQDMCKDVYEIISNQLNKSFGSKITTSISKVSPIRDVFSLIAAKAFDPFEEDIGFDISFIKSFDSIIVYGSEEDAGKFTNHFGTDKEEKYYGSLVKEGRLRFETDPGFVLSTEAVSSFYLAPTERIHKVVMTRGSDVRAAVAGDNYDNFCWMMAPIINNDDIEDLWKILKKGV